MKSVGSTDRQNGAALLAMVLVIVITASAMLFAAVRPPSGSGDHDPNTSKELAKAKAALISYAANYLAFNSDDDGPGRLPCPDSTNNGEPEASCDFSGAYRLPEYVNLPSGSTFPINDYYADLDNQFWYALSPAYRHNNSGDFLNSATATGLTLDGDPVVAVVIAPGAAVSGQTRPSSDLTGADHLESGNQDTASSAYISSDPSDPENFNDLVLGISRSEIMTPVTDMVIEVIKEAMDTFYVHPYFGNTYPPTGSTYPGHRLPYYSYSSYGYYGGPQWYRDDRWYHDVRDGGDYQLINSEVATIKFTNCDSVFTLTYGGGITRDPAKC